MLNDFRVQTIVWDKAIDRIYETVRASEGDSNGRKLRVQILDRGKYVDLVGTSLSLAWKTSKEDAKGLDAFELVDSETGTFEIYYTTEMLGNVGRLSATLVLVDSVGRIESSPFAISVIESNVDDDSVQSENSFTALAQALITVSQYDTRISGVENSKADKIYVDELHDSTTLQLAEKVSEVIYDVPNQTVKFYANDNLISEIDITEASNGSLVQDYIDSLVANGDIEGVTLSDGAVSTNNLSHDIITEDANLRDAFKFSDEVEVMGQFMYEEGYMQQTGAVSSPTSLNAVYTPNHIKINPYYKYVTNGQHGTSGNYGLCFYDKNKKFLSGVRTDSLKPADVIDFPNGTEYFRISLNADHASEFSIKKTETNLRDIVDRSLLFAPSEVTYTNSYDVPEETPNGRGEVIYSLNLEMGKSVFVREVSLKASKRTTPITLNKYRKNNDGSITNVKHCADLYASYNGEIISYKFPYPELVGIDEFLGVHYDSASTLYITNDPEGYFSYYLERTVNEGETSEPLILSNGSWKFEHSVKYSEVDNGSVDESIRGNITEILQTQAVLKEVKDSIIPIEDEEEKYPYVSVFYDNFRLENEEWMDTHDTWVHNLEEGTMQPTVSGGVSSDKERVNMLYLDRKYQANKRKFELRVNFQADTVLEIATDTKGNAVDGTAIFRWDIPNKRFEMRKHRSTRISQEGDIEMYISPDRDYIVTLEVNRLEEKMMITDFITGDSTSLEWKNTEGGVQSDNYCIALYDGSPFTLKTANVSIMNKPLVYLNGDSILAYTGSGRSGYGYKLTEELNNNVLISARGNEDARAIPELFETEIKHIKPKYFVWSHGVNGERIQESRLKQVQQLCDEHGIKFYVNHTTCTGSQSHIANNRIIESMNLRGCRFDIATARDGMPWLVEGDDAIRADSDLYRDVSTHPNELGHQKMWERFKIDLPELLLS